MDGIMIALLPISAPWSNVDPPHMTLVYAGKTNERKPSEINALMKDASSLAIISPTLILKVVGLEVFGPEDERVDVFRVLITPELAAMRNFVQKWNKSEYIEFKPHVTIGPSPSMVMEHPQLIAFDRVLLAVGEERFVFNMLRR